MERPFAEVATFRQTLFIWLLDRIRGSSCLRRLLPRLSGRRHNSWKSASYITWHDAAPTTMTASTSAAIAPKRVAFADKDGNHQRNTQRRQKDESAMPAWTIAMAAVGSDAGSPVADSTQPRAMMQEPT
jgi:hypothetical protein